MFRTNQSYARFAEGRQLWGNLVSIARDLARTAAIYLEPRRRQRVCGLVVAFALLLKAHLRSGRTRERADDPTAYRDDPTDAVTEVLEEAEPGGGGARLARRLLGGENRPFLATCELSRELDARELDVPLEVTFRLERQLAEMGRVAGACERLLSTPIPLSYTRHTGRALMLWLIAANHAMAATLGWLTPVAAFGLAFVLVGIDEISMQLEEPFCVLPLQPLCEVISDDVLVAAAWADEASAGEAAAAAAGAPAEAPEVEVAVADAAAGAAGAEHTVGPDRR